MSGLPVSLSASMTNQSANRMGSVSATAYLDQPFILSTGSGTGTSSGQLLAVTNESPVLQAATSGSNTTDLIILAVAAVAGILIVMMVHR